jgi:hypothetical protein
MNHPEHRYDAKEHADEEAEELETLAETSLEDHESLAASVSDSVAAITADIAAVEDATLHAQLEAASLGPVNRADEAYSSGDTSPDVDRLQERVDRTLASTSPDIRQHARDRAAASFLGVHPDATTPTTAGDRTWGLLSARAQGSPNISVSSPTGPALDRIVQQWKSGGTKFWADEAAGQGSRRVDRDDLADPMIRMNMLRLASPRETQSTVMDSPDALLPLVEDVIAGQASPAPIDLGRVYRRSGELRYGEDAQRLSTAMTAKVVQLGLGALSSSSSSHAAALDDRHQELIDIGATIQSDTDKDVQSVSGPAKIAVEPRPPASPYEFRYDLSLLWKSVLARARASLSPDDLRTFDTALADVRLTEHLGEWSQLRRIEAPAEQLAGAAADLADTLKLARTQLFGLAAGGSGIADTALALITRYVGPLGAEVAREVSEIGRGGLQDRGTRLGGPRSLLMLDTDAALALRATWGTHVDRIPDDFASALAKTRAGRKGDAWAKPLSTELSNWTKAMVPGGDRVAATDRLVAALKDARKAISTRPWAERRLLELLLDTTAQTAANWCDAAKLTRPGFGELAAEFRSTLTALRPPRDLVDYWRGVRKQAKGPSQAATDALTDALKRWCAEAEGKTPNVDTLETLTFDAVEAFNAYRLELARIPDQDRAAELRRALDTIASAMIAKLAIIDGRAARSEAHSTL